MSDVNLSIIFIGKGIFVTAQLLLGGLLIGILLGGSLAIARYKGYGCFFINSFISIIRGTPMILQLALVYFSIPSILGVKVNIVSAGIIAFGVNSSAYIAEIIRAGIYSIPNGQFEAGQSLQIPSFYLWKDIILPQVLKNILPALVNETIALLKETALIATIGGIDIMRSAQIVASEQYTYFVPLIIAGTYYYLLVLFIEFVGKKLEARVTC